MISLSRSDILIESRALARLAWPVIGTQLASIALSVTDVIMAGHLGVDDLAAVAVGNSLAIPVVYSFMGVLTAISPIVAQLFGGGHVQDIGGKMWQGFWVALTLGFLGLGLTFYMKPIMVFMAVDAHLIPIANQYIRALSWGIPFFLAYFVLRFFNDGLGLTRPAFLVSCLAVPFNAFCNWVLMYGHLGFPKLGAVGTGYATAAVWVLMFVTLCLWTFARKEYHLYQLCRFSPPRWPALKEIFKLGLPSGVSIGLEISMFAVISLLISSLGSNMIAAHQIAINLSSIAYMMALGVSIALTTRVGHAVGRASLPEVKKACVVGIGLACMVSLIMASIIFCFPTFLISLYTGDPEVISIAVELLVLAALFQLSDGLQVSSIGALRGLKDTQIPMYLNLAAYWAVGLPLGWLLGLYFDMGAKGFWIGLIAGLTASAVFQSIRLYKLVISSQLFTGSTGSQL